ncbi:TetR family transcriptional regulator [Alicyclobacillus contaminans]|uniref:TetR/AcrR family transcriptional regulator n=1 Tax=Alicyclobacillus contaminans TaxID=392016 RepID=UPI0003F56215|nr:TetR-like C-terminal domain-containing protein [Alicyclobacillus contaminans]GMA50576.1 TetR family transcriptional regulator [Alicyclobacillus contaminans]
MSARHGLNKAGIVRAAGKLADALGLHKLTMSLLAEHLGVRTPSLYNHVNGLEELRRELSLLGLEELNGRLQRAAMGRSGLDAIQAMLHAYRAFAKERPALYEATLRAPDNEDAALETAAHAIVDTVLTVLQPFHLQQNDAIHLVRGFRAIGHGFAALEAAGAFGMALDVDESYRRLIAAFLAGMEQR